MLIPKQILIGIYIIENKFNGQKYIGQSIDINNRLYHHKHSCNIKSKIDNAIKKYGINNFKYNIIEIVNESEYTKELLNQKEIYWIKFYNTFLGIGYNQTAGGDVISLGIDNMAYDHTLYTFYNKNGTVEENITQYNMRKKYSLDSARLSSLLSLKKEKSYKGWTLNKEYIKKVKEKPKNIIYTFYNEQYGIKKCKQIDLANEYNLDKSHLSKVCRGLIKHHKGWSIMKYN